MSLPYLVFSDRQGNIYRHPDLKMAVANLTRLALPGKEELIQLPPASTFLYLPGWSPVGFNPRTADFEVIRKFQGRKVFALAALLVPAYLRLFSPAGVSGSAKTLPLFAYTACGFNRGRFYAAAVRVDSRVRQSPRFYNAAFIRLKVKEALKKYPSNRLYRHLANCALNYNCLAAKNLFLERWEAPLPLARFCNARCLGCISYQSSGCPAPHRRINFKPHPAEVVQVMLNHLKTAREAIVSFGQGCEGEPLLEADLIAGCVSRIREKLSRGTINVNTNASLPEKIKLLCSAGVDSFRVSLNSPDEKFYRLYFKPVNYQFKDVVKSISIAKKHHKFVAVNLFVFPGFSDSDRQIKSLIQFIKDTGIDMIQWRNLNIDPRVYQRILSFETSRPRGVLTLLETIKQEFPNLKTGYFNLPRQRF